MKKEVNFVLFFAIALALVVSSLSSASADVNLTDYDVQTSYSGGDLISGSFSLTISNETNQDFSNNLDSSEISLQELLDLSGYSSGGDYTCHPTTCEDGFTRQDSGTSSKIISVDSEKHVLGFVLTGKNIVLRDFDLSVDSAIGSSCFNQLEIDLLDDGVRDFFNTNYIDQACGNKLYGCFDSTKTLQPVTIGTTPYCQKIRLPDAPAYRIGAKVINSTTTGSLRMELYDAETGAGPLTGVGCTLPTLTAGTQERDCIIEYPSINPFDAFVCIRTTTPGTSFKVMSETTNTCGLLGTDFSQSFQRAYEVYGRGLKFGTLDTTLTPELYSDINPDEDLLDVIQEYLDENYDNNCLLDCVVPFSVFGVPHVLTLDSLTIRYDAAGAAGVVSSKIYEIDIDDYKISSDELDFDFEDLGIRVPEINGKKDFELLFGGEKLIDDEINISTGFSFNINPKFSLIGKQTLFKAQNFTGNASSSWNFGDGTIKNSANAEATHRYLDAGNYDVTVTLTKSTGQKSTKTFKVLVGGAAESARALITEYESRIGNITQEINALPSWIKPEVESRVDIIGLDAAVKSLKLDSQNASEEELEDIIGSLIALEVPSSVSASEIGKAPLSVGYNTLDTRYIEEISGKSVSDDETLKLNIIGWADANYEVDIEGEVISMQTDSAREAILTKFKISAIRIGDVDEAYLIIDFPLSSINFKQDYSQEGVSGGSAAYIPLSSSGNYEFYLDEDVSISELSAYISPDISLLSTISPGDIGEPEPPAFPTGFFITGLIILIIIALAAYIFLQEWYKRNYESHLFKKKDDLYNLINFIYNSRAAGLSDSEIRKKLSKAGWKSEQMSYATRKLDGKRTGMWEIPLFKFRDNQRVRDELQRRHPGQIINPGLIGRK